MIPKIVFEDDLMVVIDKPAGMVTNNAESVKEETVQGWFSHKLQSTNDNDTEFLNKGGVVHRLDKDTSGLLVLAKTPDAYTALKQQFLERTTVKKYESLVHGDFKEMSGEISTPIERHPQDRKRFYVGTDLSRTAITEWKVINKYEKRDINIEVFTQLELTPHTGRTHQLRVHMQYLHHPIVSDPIYGYKKSWEEDLTWCPRLFLHAKYLKIRHPGSGEYREFQAPLPLDLAQALNKLVD